ncbi:MAG: hypothetical protein OJF48_004040 [Afipia sp.]|nr:MAG: hypothetical protein OJF48_004040 [Afipia sp.]
MYPPSGGQAWNGRFQALPLKSLPFRGGGIPSSRAIPPRLPAIAGYGVQSKGRE